MDINSKTNWEYDKIKYLVLLNFGEKQIIIKMKLQIVHFSYWFQWVS
jgi:hypothetical protein